ncbi:MAG: phospholipase effector Tle1 domain-containing protein, partial [Alphaproteobacteria bacterium]
GRMRFEDKTLNGDVKYARHAMSIDEDRASFARVGWGSSKSTRPEKDAQGINTFEQIWFAGNHADVGGSYPEVESRLSDISFGWMVDAATQIENGIEVDESVLSLHPTADGMQHDERKKGFPVLTKWFGITWKRAPRTVPGPEAKLHDSVYERTELPAVLQYDVLAPYRPDALRKQKRLAHLYE